MNVIIVRKMGISDAPILIRNNDDAQACYETIATKLLGDDITEFKFFDDTSYDKINRLLAYDGIEIEFFTDVSVDGIEDKCKEEYQDEDDEN